MPDDNNRQIVDEARRALADTTRSSRKLTREVARSAAALERLRRAHGADDQKVRRAEAEHTRRQEALQRSRAAVAGAKRVMTATLGEWLELEPAVEVGRLRADIPLVLFPVRLTSRFVSTERGAEFLLRIYPDTIHGSAHDPLLTEQEHDAGVAYWQLAWAGDEAQAWRELVRQVPPPRAAWIVRTTEPTNLDQRPEGEPAVPDAELRAEVWDRAAEAQLLPDRWLVMAYRGDDVVASTVSGPVSEPLAVSFDPHAPPGEGVDISGDKLELDSDLLWAVDFARAEEAGMAVRLPLVAQDLQRGFDRVLVLGIKGSLSPEDGQLALQRLFEAHHYSGGLSLLAQGTPTNNTETATSAYPPPDPDGTYSFAVERAAPLDSADGDGTRLMRALGLAPELLRHVEGADGREQPAAQAMNQALWPVTFGYYLQQMMAPHVSAAAIELARHHFVNHVRGRGPLPAFRVRGQPYGVVPVASLGRWQPRRDADRADIEIPVLLRRLRSIWQQQVSRVPRVGRTTDADADLLGILGMDASTREVRVREVHGPNFRRNLFAFAGVDGSSWDQAQQQITQTLMLLLGFPDWNPRLLHVHFSDTAARFRFPLVAQAPLSENVGLAEAFGFDYIRWVREATIDDLRHERLPEGRQAPQALLYRMLRHARLAELARVGIDLQVASGLTTAADRHEPELVGIVGATAERPTIWQRFAQPIASLTGTLSLGEFLITTDAPEVTPLRVYDAALQALEGLPTAELERLFGETLDLCSHRFDAWATSLASKRLLEMREVNPTGAYVGAFGWIENLRPEPAGRSRTTKLPDGRDVRVPVNGGGYIHAPSMQHASAAAVLRNGHLTRSGEQGAPFAVDLSSERVRTALSVLDAVREGQPLGAVFGYRFERGLHDRAVDRFIEPLRRRFPPVANKSGDADLEGPPDAIAARNVVDGVALRSAWNAGAIDLTHSDFFRSGTPPTAIERGAVERELRRLDDAVDAVADLLTAESVFQLVGGNTAGANAGLDAMAKGTRPPYPGVAMQPRPGIPLTHRVAIVLGGDPLPATGWDMAPTPRALAEPWMDGWIGQLLGNPHEVRCRVRLGVPSSGSEPPVVVDKVVTLDALLLRPIDVLALARAASEGPAPLSELDERVVTASLTTAAPGARVERITYERNLTWNRDAVRTFPEVFEVARAVDQLLAVSRPLAAADLAPPDAVSALPETEPLAGESLARALQARLALSAVREALAQAIQLGDLTALDQALRAASLFGLAGAFPRNSSEGAPLAEHAASILAESERRLAEASGASDPVAIAHAVFGRDFPFLPRLTPPQADQLRQSLSAGPVLVGDAAAPRRWIYQAARVRVPLMRWRALTLRTGTLGTHRGTLDVAQLPHRPGARWAALPFEPNAAPRGRTLSLLLDRPATPQPDEPWVGLLVDEWNELIPDESLATGLTFHFDSPGAEPPQAVLVAVPANNAERWDLDTLVATLNETLELAKLRAVDGELLGALGQLTPAVYLAANAANDTVSTGFANALIVDQPLVATEE